MTKTSRELEILVAKIQQQLAPASEVLHDVRLDGRQSGRKRQIDVLVRQQVGQYEIQVVIECKDHARPVDVKGVETFYGLLSDVGAQRGVLVCPKGFSKTAKVRAEGLQIDLYSPVDTDPHKWQAKPTIPAICDFRTAGIAFGVRMSSPIPFSIPMDFYESNIVYDMEGNELGTMLGTAMDKWNTGGFPIGPGVHNNLPLFDSFEVKTDNGHGMIAPLESYVSLHVEQQLYYGQFPILNISGFKDEISGGVIANAFTVNILSPDEVEQEWQKLGAIEDVPISPVISLTGLVGWQVG